MNNRDVLYAFVTFCICATVCCTYFFANRYTLRTSEKNLYVHDALNNTVTVYNIKGKIVAEEKNATDVAYAESVKSTKITLDYVPEKCTNEYPIELTVHNDANESLYFISFDVDIRLRGHTQSLLLPEIKIPTKNKLNKLQADDFILGFQDDIYTFDLIVPPHTSASACYAMPNHAKKIKYDKQMHIISAYNIKYTFERSGGENLFLQQRVNGK